MTRIIRNSRGQVAIFVALLFQVLFLFFAMIVNVGLLVHHKINLQNSVDLAAYYGGMKQAEVMNAISHINYQIKQSWKLLVWRHRVLGSAGAASDPDRVLPLEKINSGVAEVAAGLGGSRDYKSLYLKPRFCIAYEPHEVHGSVGKNNENTCRQAWMSTAKAALPNPGALRIPGFFSFGNTVASAITTAIDSATTRCATVGALNYVTGGRFIVAHFMDSEERAFLINYLAMGLSAQRDDFYDISGDSVRQGLEKTLRHNLTDANRESLEFDLLNGLSMDACRATGAQVGYTKGSNVPPWLVPIEVYPVWRYSDCETIESGGATTVSITGRQLDYFNQPGMSNTNRVPQHLKQQLAGLEASKALMPRPVLIGFEKDPWCMAYVGVKAKTKPKIPFMPLSEVELTAEAYTKPFGGRIGPWYTKTWDPAHVGRGRIDGTADSYNVDQMVEKNGPIRVRDLSGITTIDNPEWVPNISRFAGDRYPIVDKFPSGGYAIERVLAYFHRALRTDLNSTYYASLGQGKSYPFSLKSSDSKLSLNYYNTVGVAYTESAGSGRDQLTWDAESKSAPKLRLLEIAGIAPNIFDMSYYSIEPDFYNNYYKKILNHIEKRGGWEDNRFVLGDYGARFDLNEAAQKMNIFDQIRIQRDVEAQLESTTNMPYVVKNSEHLLNSWSVDNLLDYSQNSKLGKCNTPSGASFEQPLDPPTPGNCINGGRVGFSVKLVSKDYLKSDDLELGGQGVGGAAIRNAPPEDW